jgi:pyruvate/2-oxoglutarate dehydrogenase complex dihydrolipoamide acyltransferase (E2) component
VTAAITIPGARGADFARVAATPIASGETVSAGQVVLEVENHKVVQEIEAPADGILLHDLEPGDLVRLDLPVAFVAPGDEDGPSLITKTRPAKLDAIPDWADAEPSSEQPTEGAPLSVAKATEISVLGRGAGNSLLATVGVEIGAVQRATGTPSFFQDKILDLVVFEASRLLASKKYRKLNSRFAAGRIVSHDRVVTGVSFDEGERLTVFAIPEAEKLSLPEAQDAVVDGLMRYVGRKLSIEDVATSTFTITDTSAADLSLSIPLLPRDQCIIIAVTKDSNQSYRLNISYDHRITEGLLVASFAGELAQRVRSYGTHFPAAEKEPACTFCERTAAVEVDQFRRRGLMRIVDGAGQEGWCCATCWENW